MNLRKSRGFTLIELIVTVLIIGILTAIAIPQYLKTVEIGKADDAVSTVNMIGTANKMFALDHGGSYIQGNLSVSCGTSSCDPTQTTTACELVYCKYLADQDWGNKPYQYIVYNPTTDSLNRVVWATRLGASGDYNNWGYYFYSSGKITALGNAPPPVY